MQDNSDENIKEKNKECEEINRLKQMYENNEIDEKELIEAVSDIWYRSFNRGMAVYELQEMEEMLGDDGYCDDEEDN